MVMVPINLTSYGKNFAENLKILDSFTSNVLQAHIDGSGEKKYTVLVNILLEPMKGGELTQEKVQNEADTFAFTIRDTTPMTIN